MKQTITFGRNHNQIEITIKALNKAKARFDIHHSSYSTQIVFPDTGQKTLFKTFNYRNAVFAISRAIIKDLEANPVAEELRQMNFLTNNFATKNGWQPKRCKKVLNIDISKAYASCLLNSGLITAKTFRYLNSLKKHERLPAVGMIAKRSVVYRYNDGECVSFDTQTGKWSNIFYYVVQQVNSIMQDCQMIAGEHFCFYWVDGIFVDAKIDKQTLKELEQCLQDAGYKYKYENVENFEAWREAEKIFVKMIKNGEPKQYCYRDPNFGSNFRQVLQDISQQKLTNNEKEITDSDTI
jgi:hypothetical protein